MGKVILSGIVPLLKAPVTYKANFADNTWAQIIDACHKNQVPDTWVVGSQKTMTINGTSYPIDIIGKDHDAYSDGSGKAPLTFQMQNCYATTYGMNSSNTNVGGWTSCVMRTTRLPAILALMPSEVQAGIKQVNKLTSAGGRSSTINTTADKLFALSEIEIFGSTEYSYEGEGTQYDYYKAGNSKVKNLSGSAHIWLTRSPTNDSREAFCAVITAGDAGKAAGFYACGVAFAFCF